jgi:proteasome lid subunit RPN8/RPN11
VVGAYHSHPRSAPVPSRTDLDEALPGFFYLIASLSVDRGSLRAWRLDRTQFVEVEIFVGSSKPG